MAQLLKEKRKIFLNKKSFPQPILKVQILIRGKRVWFFSFGVLSRFPSGRWKSQRQQAFALKWVIKQGGITFRKD